MLEPDVRIPLGDLRPPFMLPAMSTFLTLLVRSILLIKKKNAHIINVCAFIIEDFLSQSMNDFSFLLEIQP